MKCKKCGNEIQEGEKFCGKCGNKIEISNNNGIKNIVKNKTKRSKSFYYIIGFIVIMFIIIICIAINNNKESRSNVSNNKNQEDIVNENKPLNIIDQNKKVFNLNIDNLSNELKKVKKDEEIANREAFKSSYELTSKTAKDPNGNLAKGYLFMDTIGKLNQYYKPPFTFATDLDGNIYRIYVLHKFKTEYGPSSVEISPSYYSWLYKALNNLGANDLSITIEKLRKEATENYNNYTPDNNGKVYIEKNGIGILQMDAGNNQYGNSAGMYLGYGTK